MRGRRRVLLASLAAVSLGGSRADATQPLADCPKGLKSHVVAELIFGRNIGEAVAGVSEAAWAGFLDEVVTPRFPAGFTALDAYGQWRDGAAGRIEREPSKMLVIVLGDEAAQRHRLGEIAAEYKRRFSQKSVLVVERRACVGF